MARRGESKQRRDQDQKARRQPESVGRDRQVESAAAALERFADLAGPLASRLSDLQADAREFRRRLDYVTDPHLRFQEEFTASDLGFEDDAYGARVERFHQGLRSSVHHGGTHDDWQRALRHQLP